MVEGWVLSVMFSHIVHAVAVLSDEPVESRQRAARESALPFYAMPLARAMLRFTIIDRS